MKAPGILILLIFIVSEISCQVADSALQKTDSIRFQTSNGFIVKKNNFELFNSSFITGNAYGVIRSQDNPKISVDGIPVNPNLYNNNAPYPEFLGNMNLLSFDLEEVSCGTLISGNKIVSGTHNNAIEFKTTEIILNRKEPVFEFNNFTAFEYQGKDTLGYSTITNFNFQQGYEKFGYRFSIINGFHNDYISENGLQRYGGNFKLKYKPYKKISLNGFIDYTNFQSFKRTGENNLDADRLFTWATIDVDLTRGFQLYGKYAFKLVSDISQRNITDEWSWEEDYFYSEYYLEKIKYKYNNSFWDIGLNFKKSLTDNALINVNLGYYLSNNQHFGRFESYYHNNHNSYAEYISKLEPKTKESLGYSSLNFKYKGLVIKYFFDITNYRFQRLILDQDERKTLFNHVLSSNLDFINNENKILNKLGIQLNFGKLANYTIIPQPITYSPGNASIPDWIIKFDNVNIELGLYSSFLKNLIHFNISVYQKMYPSYNHLFNYSHLLQDIGKITKNGLDLNVDASIVRKLNIEWDIALSYNMNSSKLDQKKDLIFVMTDTTIQNHIVILTNKFRYRNFELLVEVEAKNGFDVNLYRNNISVAEPFTYREHTTVIGVDNQGIPITQTNQFFDNNITDTDYLILKHLGIEYHPSNKAKRFNYSIGLHYNKMRRMYLYVNDVELYQNQFQQPSFYNVMSLSLKASF